jgi:hypothetical protein
MTVLAGEIKEDEFKKLKSQAKELKARNESTNFAPQQLELLEKLLKNPISFDLTTPKHSDEEIKRTLGVVKNILKFPRSPFDRAHPAYPILRFLSHEIATLCLMRSKIMAAMDIVIETRPDKQEDDRARKVYDDKQKEKIVQKSASRAMEINKIIAKVGMMDFMNKKKYAKLKKEFMGLKLS